MIDRVQQQRKFDKHRRQRHPWRKWYYTKAWKKRRAEQLARIPWCEPCKRMGKSRPATIANHKTPHRGDRELFFRGALESACKNCHDQAIQRAEIEGFSREIDEDGWPVDPNHRFNRPTVLTPLSGPPISPPARPPKKLSR